MKFRKTALIEAEQFLPAQDQIPNGIYSSGPGDPRMNSAYHWLLETLEGTHAPEPGDWIVTGINGEKYNCAADIFAKTYESAETKRRFTVVETYEAEDEHFSGDALDVSLVDEKDDVILTGDYYHDKIDETIDGFFDALDYLGIEYERVDVQRNSDDDEGDGEPS